MLLNLQSRTPRLVSFRDEPILRRFCTHCGPMFIPVTTRVKRSYNPRWILRNFHTLYICNQSISKLWLIVLRANFWSHFHFVKRIVIWILTNLLPVQKLNKEFSQLFGYQKKNKNGDTKTLHTMNSNQIFPLSASVLLRSVYAQFLD